MSFLPAPFPSFTTPALSGVVVNRPREELTDNSSSPRCPRERAGHSKRSLSSRSSTPPPHQHLKLPRQHAVVPALEANRLKPRACATPPHPIWPEVSTQFDDLYPFHTLTFSVFPASRLLLVPHPLRCLHPATVALGRTPRIYSSEKSASFDPNIAPHAFQARTRPNSIPEAVVQLVLASVASNNSDGRFNHLFELWGLFEGLATLRAYLCVPPHPKTPPPTCAPPTCGIRRSILDVVATPCPVRAPLRWIRHTHPASSVLAAKETRSATHMASSFGHPNELHKQLRRRTRPKRSGLGILRTAFTRGFRS
ncbi:hypothetical protein B0H10DRAFT_2324490 [Mycena sp. CBHHK59/15]|nr:hypothetical protein B0H10DRAFT_2324490 [Mycena sp. CBHHK59/15]